MCTVLPEELMAHNSVAQQSQTWLEGFAASADGKDLCLALLYSNSAVVVGTRAPALQSASILIVVLLADNETDDDVLDPAQLAFASTDTQAVQQQQQPQQQQ